MRDSVSKAKSYALRLIRYRDRSEKELTERLKLKGFSDGAIAETLRLLKNADLVNDSSLARTLNEIAHDVKLLGNRGTAFFLKKRGISNDIIAELPLYDVDEFDRAMTLVRRKMKSFFQYPLDIRAKKIKGILMRRGYSFETIARVMRRVSDDNEDRIHE